MLAVLHRHAVGDQSMAIDAFSHDGTVTDGASRSAAVGKRPTCQRSWFQPRPTIQRLGFGGVQIPSAALQLVERISAGQIELERAEAQRHDMAVGIDQSRHQGLAAPVDLASDVVKRPVAAVDHPAAPAVVVD